MNSSAEGLEKTTSNLSVFTSQWRKRRSEAQAEVQTEAQFSPLWDFRHLESIAEAKSYTTAYPKGWDATIARLST